MELFISIFLILILIVGIIKSRPYKNKKKGNKKKGNKKQSGGIIDVCYKVKYRNARRLLDKERSKVTELNNENKELQKKLAEINNKYKNIQEQYDTLKNKHENSRNIIPNYANCKQSKRVENNDIPKTEENLQKSKTTELTGSFPVTNKQNEEIEPKIFRLPENEKKIHNATIKVPSTKEVIMYASFPRTAGGSIYFSDLTENLVADSYFELKISNVNGKATFKPLDFMKIRNYDPAMVAMLTDGVKPNVASTVLCIEPGKAHVEGNVWIIDNPAKIKLA